MMNKPYTYRDLKNDFFYKFAEMSDRYVASPLILDTSPEFFHSLMRILEEMGLDNTLNKEELYNKVRERGYTEYDIRDIENCLPQSMRG